MESNGDDKKRDKPQPQLISGLQKSGFIYNDKPDIDNGFKVIVIDHTKEQGQKDGGKENKKSNKAKAKTREQPDNRAVAKPAIMSGLQKDGFAYKDKQNVDYGKTIILHNYIPHSEPEKR